MVRMCNRAKCNRCNRETDWHTVRGTPATERQPGSPPPRAAHPRFTPPSTTGTSTNREPPAPATHRCGMITAQASGAEAVTRLRPCIYTRWNKRVILAWPLEQATKRAGGQHHTTQLMTNSPCAAAAGTTAPGAWGIGSLFGRG